MLIYMYDWFSEQALIAEAKRLNDIATRISQISQLPNGRRSWRITGRIGDINWFSQIAKTGLW